MLLLRDVVEEEVPPRRVPYTGTVESSEGLAVEGRPAIPRESVTHGLGNEARRPA